MQTSAPRDFLFTTWEGGGHVTPALWAAARLAERGHRVRVISDQANAEEAAGFGLVLQPWTQAPNRIAKGLAHDPIRDFEPTEPAGIIERLCERLIVGPALDYARDVRDALDAQPEAVVVSQELLFGAMMGAEAHDAPLALLTANTWPLPTLDVTPPFGPGLEPATEPVRAYMDTLIRQAARAFYDQHLPALNAARRELGLRPLSTLLEQVDSAELILLGTSAAFDFASVPLPAPFVYAGPQVRVPSWAAPWRSPFAADDARPLLLVCFSTLYQGQEATLRRVIEALAPLPVRAVVTLGPALDAADFPDPPGNVAVLDSASHDALMPEVAGFVGHAGHGAVIRPLLHGVPLLSLPMGRDQADNAVRVTARGAGLKLDPDAGVEAIRAAVMRLIDEPAFAAAAYKLGRAIADEQAREGDVVVRELEILAARTASRPRGAEYAGRVPKPAAGAAMQEPNLQSTAGAGPS